MRIDTVEARSRLKHRRSPYWHKLSTGRQLGFRKMSLGASGTWLAQAYDEVSRKQVRKALDIPDDIPQSKRFDEAVKAARAWFEHIDAGGGTKVLTVRDACRDYVESLRRHRPATASDAEARFARWILSQKIADIPLQKLTERHVRGWRLWLSETDVIVNPHSKKPAARKRSASSVNRDMTALRAALNLAHRSRAVTSDMAWRFALAPITNADRRRGLYLDIAERRALIEKAPPDLAAFLRALCLVPIRPGALAALSVANFDRRHGVLHVGNDKAGGNRRITLPPDSAEFFASQCQSKTPLAPLFARADGKPWDKDAWKRPLKAAATAAELSQATTAYSLRHSVITDLVVGGLDLLTVAQLSGTSVSMIERHYGHHRADRAAAALAKLAV